MLNERELKLEGIKDLLYCAVVDWILQKFIVTKGR